MTEANSNITTFQAPKSDVVRGAEIRAALGPLLEQVCVIMNQARAEGLVVQFQISNDPYGRAAVQPTQVFRPV